MSLKQKMSKMGHSIKEHSPLIFTAAGVVGLGATAYLAFKAKPKVEAIVEDMENDRLNNVEIDQVEAGKQLIGALALPVITGTLSCVSIILAYKIQNDRILVLSESLAMATATMLQRSNKYKEMHGEESFTEWIAPTEKETTITTDKKGKEKEVITDIKKESIQADGVWFSQSSESSLDDHVYNMQYVRNAKENLELRLFQKGTILLNEVYDELGIKRTRMGQLMGWTTGDDFQIDPRVTMMGNQDKGEAIEQIYVTWTYPRYIFEDVELSGRYSPFTDTIK